MLNRMCKYMPQFIIDIWNNTFIGFSFFSVISCIAFGLTVVSLHKINRVDKNIAITKETMRMEPEIRDVIDDIKETLTRVNLDNSVQDANAYINNFFQKLCSISERLNTLKKVSEHKDIDDFLVKWAAFYKNPADDNYTIENCIKDLTKIQHDLERLL